MQVTPYQPAAKRRKRPPEAGRTEEAGSGAKCQWAAALVAPAARACCSPRLVLVATVVIDTPSKEEKHVRAAKTYKEDSFYFLINWRTVGALGLRVALGGRGCIGYTPV